MKEVCKMKNNILQQLYDGDMFPAERTVPKCPGYRETVHTFSDEQQHFYDTLGEEGRKRFDDLSNLRCELEGMENYASFASGFRLGVCLTVEAFTGE